MTLQGHPMSMIFVYLTRHMRLPIISIHHRLRDMASFPLKNAHFSYPTLFNPQFENVSLGVNG